VFGEVGVPIRWGGDEFVVLLDENREEVLEKYMTTLVDEVDKHNKSGKMPYHIDFSYGMTVFNNSYRSIDELIRYSDELMYQAKQSKQKQ
jgi:diguanylate cyclase (GGDEF)-like protein